MMRILVWNIQFFTDARVTARRGRDPVETHRNELSALLNLNYIVGTVRLTAPDVFVIVEAQSYEGNEAGTLARGEGPNGLRKILAELRARQAPPEDWYLVPPLRVNPRGPVIEGRAYTETVGVFWNNNQVQFTGPFVWPAGANNATGPSVAAGAPGTYPPPWDNTVPAGTTAAAQCRFIRGTHNRELVFPNRKNRRPYLTTFQERYGAQRLVKLFSVHTTPKGTEAVDAMERLKYINGAVWEPNAGEVTVFAGDWNVNLLNPRLLERDFFTNAAAYQQLVPVPSWDDIRAFELYGGTKPRTRYHPRKDATPALYVRPESLDYAFFRYGSQGAPAGAPRMMVVDRVTTPVPAPPAPLPNPPGRMRNQLHSITGFQPPLEPAPLGAVRTAGVTTFTTIPLHRLEVGDGVSTYGVLPAGFNTDFPAVRQVLSPRVFTVDDPGPDATGGGGYVTSLDASTRLFRQMENFGHLGPPVRETPGDNRSTSVGTSDHLPIFVIV